MQLCCFVRRIDGQTKRHQRTLAFQSNALQPRLLTGRAVRSLLTLAAAKKRLQHGHQRVGVAVYDCKYLDLGLGGRQFVQLMDQRFQQPHAFAGADTTSEFDLVSGVIFTSLNIPDCNSL